MRDYDSTVARIAGNLMSGGREHHLADFLLEKAVKNAVATARMIVEEVRRTEPLRAVTKTTMGPSGGAA